MARIARALEGADDWADAADAADYVRRHLGRRDGTTFLTELSPFPAREAQPAELGNFADRELIDAVLTERHRTHTNLR